MSRALTASGAETHRSRTWLSFRVRGVAGAISRIIFIVETLNPNQMAMLKPLLCAAVAGSTASAGHNCEYSTSGTHNRFMNTGHHHQLAPTDERATYQALENELFSGTGSSAGTAVSAPTPLTRVVSINDLRFSPFAGVTANYSGLNMTSVNCLSVSFGNGHEWPDDYIYSDRPPPFVSYSTQEQMGVMDFFASNATVYHAILASVRYFNTGLSMGRCNNTCWDVHKSIVATVGQWQPPLGSGSGVCEGTVVAQSPFHWWREAGVDIASPPFILRPFFCETNATVAAFDFVSSAYGGSFGLPLCTNR